jgi:transposase
MVARQGRGAIGQLAAVARSAWEACVGAHHLCRKLQALAAPGTAHAREVRATVFEKGQKNDFRDAEAIAEAVQRPTMKFVATKTVDLQTLHRVRERLVRGQRRWKI